MACNGGEKRCVGKKVEQRYKKRERVKGQM
jgi:hypothetical protein